MKPFGSRYCRTALLSMVLSVSAGAASGDDRASSNRAGAAPETARPRPLPPIFLAGERIVFQGDATIDGGRWRERDLKEPIWQDYAYMIAAEYGEAYPERHLTFIDRAVQGDRIISLTGRWRKDTLALKPDVVSILIGINDLRIGPSENRSELVSHYEKAYDDLLAGTRKVNPRVKLMLCSPFVLPSKYTVPQWAEWLELIRQVEKEVDKLGVKYHAPVAHFQKLITLSDPVATPVQGAREGLLPTFAEHRRMAAEWVSVYQAGYGLPEKPGGDRPAGGHGQAPKAASFSQAGK